MLELPDHLNRPRLRRQQACEYLDIKHGLKFATKTLEKYAYLGKGPAYQRVNRTPFYTVEELDRWANELLGEC